MFLYKMEKEGIKILLKIMLNLSSIIFVLIGVYLAFTQDILLAAIIFNLGISFGIYAEVYK